MKLARFAAAAGLVVAAAIGGVAAAAPANAYPTGTITTDTINATVFRVGNNVTINVFNATPGATLTLTLYSDPVVIASGAVVGQNGRGVISGPIPAGFPLGAHTAVVTSSLDAVIQPGRHAITVVDENGNVGPGNPAGGGSGSGDDGGLASTGAAVTGIGILGGLLVAGGVFFVVAGRRRTAANQTPLV